MKLGNALPAYIKLEGAQKLAFLEYEVVVRDLGSLTEDQTRDLFYRINSTSYGLNAMEVNNARFDGALKRFCDDLSENPFFVKHQTFNSFDAKRMNDVRWCLTLVITMLSSYFNRDSEHEDYLERYNDDFPQHSDIDSRLQHVFSYMEDLDFDAYSRVWQKSDLFTCMVELDRARDLLDSLELSQVSAALHTFYQNVDRAAAGEMWQGLHDDYQSRAAEYFAAARSGSNDRSSRVRRGEIVSSVIRGSRNLQQKAD